MVRSKSHRKVRYKKNMDRQKYVNNQDYRDGFDAGIEFGREQIKIQIKHANNELEKILNVFKNILEESEDEKDILIKAIGNGTLPMCKDCKYFEYDSVAKVDGIQIPLIVAHEICSKWGDGCKTREDGYCFLFEPKEEEDE